jgi:hypothetical protein
MEAIMSDIGHNAPPAYEAISLHIEDLIAEAHNFLDGEPIADQGQADAIGVLLDSIRQAKKAADDQRVIEKKPHDEAAKAVQVKYKPLIDKCDLAASVAKKALTPWLQHLEDEQRRIAEEKRLAAEELQRQVREAEIAARTDLAAAEKAEAAQLVADEATKAAVRAEKAKAHATGGSRAIGLRTSYRAEITDPLAFGKWAWNHRRAEYQEFLEHLAERECRHGPVTIPGIIVHTERQAA